MIANFEFRNPVKIVFGEQRLEELSNYIPKKKILLVYGQGSIKNNGIYERVLGALEGHDLVEYGGVEPNPEFETLMGAVALGRKEKVEFILAVGGGSVVDGSKFIAAAIPFQDDPWTILSKGARVERAIPLGTVLTLPATGSEMNSGAVISRASTGDKLFFGTPLCYPVFSIMDVSTLVSLPERQRANGVIDAFVHTTEQYMTYPVGARMHDRMAEGIFQTLIELGPEYVKKPFDREVAANVMFAATMALNGWLSTGVPTDWSIHMIGHELTALYGIDHGRSLAAVLPSMYRVMLDEKTDKLSQYAKRVWGIQGDDRRELAKEAIARTEQFFNELGVPTRISYYAKDLEKTQSVILEKFAGRGWKSLGERGRVDADVVRRVIEMAW